MRDETVHKWKGNPQDHGICQHQGDTGDQGWYGLLHAPSDRRLRISDHYQFPRSGSCRPAGTDGHKSRAGAGKRGHI